MPFKLKLNEQGTQRARDFIHTAFAFVSRCLDVPFLLVMLWTACVFGSMSAGAWDLAALLLFGCFVVLQLAVFREKLKKLRSNR